MVEIVLEPLQLPVVERREKVDGHADRAVFQPLL